MDSTVRLRQLARITNAPTPVVSVYLNTRWADEHQRDRVRVFLKSEIRKARETGGRALDEALEWVWAQGSALIDQARWPDAQGAALIVCTGLGLREVLPVRVPLDDAFVVSGAPFLRPLAAVLDESPATLVVFVDGESARVMPLGISGAGEEVALESEVPGHHRRGGWAQLAQSRYQRHIQDHRGRHFEAVVEALTQLSEDGGAERIVLAGEARTLAAFRQHLPPRLDERVAGAVPAARHEPSSAIVGRAADVVARTERAEAQAAASAIVTEAAKGGQAVAGLGETLEAATRGAVRRLFLLKGFAGSGRVCASCGALQVGLDGPCRMCGRPTVPADLGAALVGRVLATGGAVSVLDEHAELARVGGVGALLRYPL